MNINTKLVSNRLILKQFSIQVALLVLTVLLLFSFQNCSAPLEEEDLSSLGDTAPFAYESLVDHIAYLSCSGVSNNNLFTFKAGAYNAGSGLKLRQEFLDATNKLTPAARAGLLSTSLQNADVFHQMSVRDYNDFLDYYSPIGQFFNRLSAAPYSDALANLAPGARLNSMNNKPMESSINLSNLVESAHLDMRNSLSAAITPKVLAFHFGKGNSISQPEGGGNVAYGRGFFIGFNGHAMSSAVEGNMEDGVATGRAFTCPSTLYYKVVQFEHRGGYTGSTCSTLIPQGQDQNNPALMRDNVPASGQALTDYNTVRKILPDIWAVDGVNKCIVPKISMSCYSSAFNPASSVTAGQGYNSNWTCSGANCSQYLSVCKSQ